MSMGAPQGKINQVKGVRQVYQSDMVLSSQCIHSSEAQHGVGGHYPEF